MTLSSILRSALGLRSALAIACCGAFALSAHAFARPLPQPASPYSATMIVDIGQDHYRSTVVADGARERRVIDTPYGPQTLLVDRVAHKAYLIQSQLAALAVDLSAPDVGLDIGQIYAADGEPVGRERIDGVNVTRYRVKSAPARDVTFTGTAWLTDDGIIIKLDGTGRYRDRTSPIAMRLTDLRRTDPAPEAFLLPQGMPIVDAKPLVKQLLPP